VVSTLIGKATELQEQLANNKRELGVIRHSLLTLRLEKGDEVEISSTSLEKEIFDYSLLLKKLLFTPSLTPD